MRNLSLALVLVLSGCCTGHLKVTEVEETMRSVIFRHQGYVEQDKGLSDLERRIYLRDGAVLEEALDAGQPPAEEDENG